jgi:hypothetical protein
MRESVSFHLPLRSTASATSILFTDVVAQPDANITATQTSNANSNPFRMKYLLKFDYKKTVMESSLFTKLYIGTVERQSA